MGRKIAGILIGAIILAAGAISVYFLALENNMVGSSDFASASDINTSVNVATFVCGNNIIEPPWEVCDDGLNNGQYGYCWTDCQGLGPHCGDGIIQPAHEQCDLGLLNGSCPSVCSASCANNTCGGGGGGPGVTWGAVDFRGWSYPGATISLLQDGSVVATTVAGPSGYFEVSLTNINPGSYNYAISGQDISGLHSTSQTYPITVAAGSTSYVTDVILPPTASTDKTEVKQGNIINISGQSIPNSPVTIFIHGATSTFSTSFTTTANALGEWTYAFNTTGTPAGNYYVQTQTTYQGNASPLSAKINFTIGAQDVVLDCWRRADLNCDGYVDLIDYSIAAYWWKRPLTPQAIIKVDNKLYPDGVVNLRDFSVMAYYWTGSRQNVAAGL
jgi:hypothetical protein